MQIINTSLVGAREHPLQEAQRFVLICCCCCGIPVEQYRRFSTLSAPEKGWVGPGVEYFVQIAMDQEEIHAYLRLPSVSRMPVLELIFFRDDTSTTAA